MNESTGFGLPTAPAVGQMWLSYGTFFVSRMGTAGRYVASSVRGLDPSECVPALDRVQVE